MENKNAQKNSSNGTDASPNGVGDADWDGLSGFGKKDSAQHIEEGKACYPSPEFCAIDKFSFTEAESECGFAETCYDEDEPVHDLIP